MEPLVKESESGEIGENEVEFEITNPEEMVRGEEQMKLDFE